MTDYTTYKPDNRIWHSRRSRRGPLGAVLLVAVIWAAVIWWSCR